MEFSLRDARPEDDVFLLRLYKSTREEEIAAWGWPPPQAEAFLRMQFLAQRASYRAMYAQAVDQIIEVAEVAAGRILVERAADETRLIDIALLPEYRQRGIGECLIRQLMEECAHGPRPLRLQVLQSNRARRLYHRLGFRTHSEDQMYVAMEWLPDNLRKL